MEFPNLRVMTPKGATKYLRKATSSITATLFCERQTVETAILLCLHCTRKSLLLCSESQVSSSVSLPASPLSLLPCYEMCPSPAFALQTPPSWAMLDVPAWKQAPLSSMALPSGKASARLPAAFCQPCMVAITQHGFGAGCWRNPNPPLTTCWSGSSNGKAAGNDFIAGSRKCLHLIINSYLACFQGQFRYGQENQAQILV